MRHGGYPVANDPKRKRSLELDFGLIAFFVILVILFVVGATAAIASQSLDMLAIGCSR